MRHFDPGQWADYVRGLLTPRNRAAMEEHLMSGCEECQRAADLLQRFALVAHQEARYNVPGYAVRIAQAIFALQQPERVHIIPRIAARLVFDSFREPLPAGVRSGHRISRQVLYEAGDYALDLRLEHERGSLQVTLVGQIANQTEPSKPLADVPVFLLAPRRIVARARTNSFGEFQMEYEPSRKLRLYVPVEDGQKRIDVALNGFASEISGNGESGAGAPKRRRKKG